MPLRAAAVIVSALLISIMGGASAQEAGWQEGRAT
jgi:hypothetical protein